MRVGQLLRHDLPASLVVFLVAVPLSLGIAVASGAPIMAGIIAAVVGGIVVGVWGGAPLQVSGPAAGLTVVVAGLISEFGWRATCALTVAAGLVQMGLGASRIARAVLAISPSVVHGMLAGIGTTVAVGQLRVLLGGKGAHSPLENLAALPGLLTGIHDTSAVLGIGVIVVLLVWPHLPLRTVPGPLVAVVGVTLLAEVLALEVTRIDLPGSLAGAVQLPRLPQSTSPTAVVVGVATLAIVASLESLMSALAVDKLRPSGPRANLDRELIGQGAANTVSGLLGGLPVTGVIVRSSTNVRAGAVSRASAILHGVWVLLFSLLFVAAIERIPTAVLAGLLVVVGAGLIRPADVRMARQHGDLPAYLATIVGVVLLGLLEGVLVGVVVSLALMLRRLVGAQLHAVETGGRWQVVAGGTLSFLSVPRLSRVLAEIPPGSVVDLHLVVDFLDHAAADHLLAWRVQHEASGGVVLVDEVELVPRSTPATAAATTATATAPDPPPTPAQGRCSRCDRP
jgi:carbonic anhydrase